MASTKDFFAAKFYAANFWGAGLYRGYSPPSVVGMEYAQDATNQRLHYHGTGGAMDYVVSGQRLQYVADVPDVTEDN